MKKHANLCFLAMYSLYHREFGWEGGQLARAPQVLRGLAAGPGWASRRSPCSSPRHHAASHENQTNTSRCHPLICKELDDRGPKIATLLYVISSSQRGIVHFFPKKNRKGFGRAERVWTWDSDRRRADSDGGQFPLQNQKTPPSQDFNETVSAMRPATYLSCGSHSINAKWMKGKTWGEETK